MAVCRCGADVRWVLTSEGERIAIDARVAAYSGPGRYRIVAFEPAWLAELIDERASAAGHPDHRLACPAVSAAERRRLLLALRGDADEPAVHAGAPGGP